MQSTVSTQLLTLTPLMMNFRLQKQNKKLQNRISEIKSIKKTG